MKKRAIRVLGVGASAVLSTLTTQLAYSQQWSALEGKPKANFVAAFDHSVTMAINDDCSRCHSSNPIPTPPTEDRLHTAKNNFIGTGPTFQDGVQWLFRDKFVWGALGYSGDDFAKVTSSVAPDITDILGSYTASRALIDALVADTAKEDQFPGGAAVNCATSGCTDDAAVVTALLSSVEPFGAANGFRWNNSGQIPATVVVPVLCDPLALSPPCGMPGCAYNPRAAIVAGLTGVSWPRFSPPPPSAGEVQRDFCQVIDPIVNTIWNALQQCLPGLTPTWPTAASVMNFGQYQCIPGLLKDEICASSSPFGTGGPAGDTCVCGDTSSACFNVVALSDECGIPFAWKARQQVAMCASTNPDVDESPFVSTFSAQADNVLNPGGCRSNVLGFFTDGYMGDTGTTTLPLTGVRGEAPDSAQIYRGEGGYPQSFVFHVSNQFGGMADTMQSLISDGQIATAYDATSQTSMAASFSRIVNRILRGSYSSANVTIDPYGTRAAFYIYEVPGRPLATNADHLKYLGRPSRIAWHSIDAVGNVSAAPLWETDWASRTGTTTVIYGTGPGAPLGDDVRLGPGGTWTSTGATSDDKVQTIPAGSLDRDGDDVVDATPEDIVWGFMLGGENSQPVIVEAPGEIPAGANAQALSAFQVANANRPRAIYVQSNGYLHAIHGGDRIVGATLTIGNNTVTAVYDDSAAIAGTEIFRYRPAFIYDPANASASRVEYNESLQQPLLNGQIIVREIQTRFSPPPITAVDFMTILVMSQGPGGRGYAALNVTDPTTPIALWDTLLLGNNDRATAKPSIYTWPAPAASGGRQTALVLTSGSGDESGLVTSSSISAYRLTGAVGAPVLISSAPLPSAVGESWRTEPVCVDVKGEGKVTYCYMVRSDGLLYRVGINPNTGAFSGARNLNTDFAPGLAAGERPIGGGREYWTPPVVYFGTTNKVNIFFGSGDINAFGSPSGTQNLVYKVVDDIGVSVVNSPSIAQSCFPLLAFDDGAIPMSSASEELVSPPVVSKGVVAWTTYQPGSTGCVGGTARLYAMDFETCKDAFSGTGLPVPLPAGMGIPTSPVLLRRVDRILTHTSAEPTATGAGEIGVPTRAGARAGAIPLYWRLERRIQ